MKKLTVAFRYIEYNKSKNKELKGKHNPLFKKMAREQQRRKAQKLEI
jgi:DNA excision repair protein ERCC-3